MPSRTAARTPTEPASLPRHPAVLGPLVHPGELLLQEFLRPLGVQQSVVAHELGISRNRLNQLVLGKRSVTADTAIRLERRFKLSARFWLHLQADYDLQTALNETGAVGRRTKRSGQSRPLVGQDEVARPASAFSRVPCPPRPPGPARNRQPAPSTSANTRPLRGVHAARGATD